ncbi:MAG TPA: hypothetical protein VJ552_11910 [Sediminibacterium sp.]|nr:hypothetical protein [Sediminibacterium sp.]
MRKNIPHLLLVLQLCCLVAVQQGIAQQYHALHGSSFAGAAGMFNNPASPVNSVHKWDLNLFSFQLANATNSAEIKNGRITAFADGSLRLTPGNQKRWLHQNMDISLLNAMYKINARTSLAGGLRIRTYNHIRTSAFNFNDSINSLKKFLIGNRTTDAMQGIGIHSGWLEGNLNYSHVLKETQNSKLSGGITLQIMKNISGSYARVNKLSYAETILPGDTIYSLVDGSAGFGYSANYDATNNQSGAADNAKSIFKQSLTSFGLSIGLEYLAYDTETVTGEGEPAPYRWKLGLSLMDIGNSQYTNSRYTGQFSNPDQSVTNQDLYNKFSSINSARSLRDSLATVFQTVTTLPSKFSIAGPSRIILNADRNLGNHFYVNAELSLNLRSTYQFNQLNTRETNLLTITPRWEILNWGFYLPVQYNTQGQWWLGAAFKAGPLVAGMHHIGLLKRDPALNGGGYIMLSIHPFRKRSYGSRLDCLD